MFQVLRPSAPTCRKLPQEEVWPHQQPASQEEAEVDCRSDVFQEQQKILCSNKMLLKLVTLSLSFFIRAGISGLHTVFLKLGVIFTLNKECLRQYLYFYFTFQFQSIHSLIIFYSIDPTVNVLLWYLHFIFYLVKYIVKYFLIYFFYIVKYPQSYNL